MFRIEGRSSENLVKESLHHTSETGPSAVKLVDTLKRATIIPAFARNIASGNIEVKENNKLYSRAQLNITEDDYTHNYAGHKISDIRIAPSENANGYFNSPHTESAIHNITLAVLRGKVNPARQKMANYIKKVMKFLKMI